MVKVSATFLYALVFFLFANTCFGETTRYFLPNGEYLTIIYDPGTEHENSDFHEIYYKNKLVYKKEHYNITVDYFALGEMTVILTTIGNSSCEQFPYVLISIDKNDNVEVSKEFGQWMTISKISQESEKLILELYDDDGFGREYYTYVNGKLSVDMNNYIPFSGITGAVVQGNDLVKRYTGEEAASKLLDQSDSLLGIFDDPDFIITMKANFRISNEHLHKLRLLSFNGHIDAVKDGPDKSLNTGMVIKLDSDSEHYGFIKISRVGPMSCFGRFDISKNQKPDYRFYTNDQKLANSVDLSFVPSDLLPDTFTLKHFFRGKEQIMDYVKAKTAQSGKTDQSPGAGK